MSGFHDPTRGPRGREAEDGRIRRAFDLISKLFRERGVPPGVIYVYPFATAPLNHVVLYGQTITNAQSLYPDLWDVADSTWKSGSDLVCPDLRGRIPVGLDNMGGSDAGRLSVANTMGGTGGTETHTLTSAQVPALGPSGGGSFVKDGSGAAYMAAAGTYGPFNVTGTTTGSGGSHPNMQPYILLNWIMKLK